MSASRRSSPGGSPPDGADPGTKGGGPAAVRTAVLTAALLLLGLALAPVTFTRHWPAPLGTSLTWWHLALLFAAAEVLVVHVEVDSEAQTFLFSEVPLVLGLFFAQPRDIVLGRMAGEALVLLAVVRQPVAKLAFNLCLFLAESATALAIVHALGRRPDPLQPLSWVCVLLGVAAASLLSSAAVTAVIRLQGGEVRPRAMVVSTAFTVIGNGSLAALAAVALRTAPLALLPLLAIGGVLLIAYRGYNRLAQRYQGLQLLYEFTRITSGAQRPERTMQRVLAEAGHLLRARRTIVALFSPGQERPWLFLETVTDGGTTSTHRLGDDVDVPAEVRRQVLGEGRTLLAPRAVGDPALREVLAALDARDCLAAPLPSGGDVDGVLLVCDRLGGVSTFDAEDGRLFETLASQAAIALENARLVERLREQTQAREHEALHDALTGLPNRTMFYDRLRHSLDISGTRPGGVLLMDLDGFKEVNDTLGHHVGDQLLQEVGRRLAETVADRGLVARLGGDEFVVLLPDLGHAAAGLAVAAELAGALHRPMRLASMTLEMSSSIGMAVWPEHGTEPTTLLQRADIAMYSAKRQGGGTTLYDPDDDWNSQLRLRLAGELRAALANHEIDVWYQPIVRAADGHVVGAEALVRWLHPELGRLGPGEFVPVAERSGLIHDLTLYVLDDALARACQWRAQGLELFVTVNLPPQVLRDVEWATKVAEYLVRHGADARWLTFEITENGIMTDPERMVSILTELTGTGIEVAIDDFGTGYSSLAYLQQLPVSKVKIDKSFVMAMTSDPAAAAIVRSVVDLSRSLGLTVVAEGVEDAPTLDHLVRSGCPLVQGYLFSRPVPAPDLTAWMQRSGRPRATSR